MGKSSSIQEALKYAFFNKKIRSLLIMAATIFCWGISQPLIPIFSRDILNLEGMGYAILSSIYYIGVFGGALTLFFFGKYFGSKLLVICVSMYCILTILFFLVTNTVLASILLIMSGYFQSMWLITIIVKLIQLSDESMRGRIYSFLGSLMGLSGVGFIVGGLFEGIIGLKLTIIISFTFMFFVHAILYLSKSFRET